MKRKRLLKILGWVMAVIFLVLFIGFLHVRSVAIGKTEASVPANYQTIEANGYTFSTQISGDPDSTAVILLHGFPESSAMWKQFMSDLNKEGYYTIAPDQRGYSAGARPSEIEQYEVKHLGSDVIEIAKNLGIDQFHLVGHDWGSGVGWWVAAQYPEQVLSYTSLSVPHLGAFGRAYREDSLQHTASGYIRNFQIKILPEYYIARGDYKLLRSFYNRQGPEETQAYIDLFSQKRALTGAINWYRANFDVFDKGLDLPAVKVPVLFMWGNKDRALQRSGVEWTEEYVENYYRFVELEAGHWLIQEKYDTVSQEILQHFQLPK